MLWFRKQIPRPKTAADYFAEAEATLVPRLFSAWIEKKFLAPGKVAARNRAWPGLTWTLEFVRGSLRHPEELELIRSHGIQTRSFYSVLASLCHEATLAHKGGAGTDIAEMIAYYVRCRDAKA